VLYPERMRQPHLRTALSRAGIMPRQYIGQCMLRSCEFNSIVWYDVEYSVICPSESLHDSLFTVPRQYNGCILRSSPSFPNPQALGTYSLFRAEPFDSRCSGMERRDNDGGRAVCKRHNVRCSVREILTSSKSDIHADVCHARFLEAIPEQARIRISDAFDVPAFIHGKPYKEASGYFWSGEKHLADGKLGSHTTSFRFLIKHAYGQKHVLPRSPNSPQTGAHLERRFSCAGKLGRRCKSAYVTA
jgi:hypothetical protein